MVSVDRDDLGVPTIEGSSRVDVARATGFVHAQDRFFQMDLMRRRSAGELSALFGEATLSIDCRYRLHRLRTVAVQVVEGLDPKNRELLSAYAEGVNEGLKQLASRPPEYWIISASPEPWRIEDSILVVHSMYLELNDEEAVLESRQAFLRDCLPSPAADFLTSADASWAAPVDGGQLASTPVPEPATYDLRELAGVDFGPTHTTQESLGNLDGNSNGWAVSGRHTDSGSAIVANDMHLALRLPNTWYRMRLRVQGASPSIDVTGVTLPGIPTVVAGSNGRVAWGFTNSYGDWTDRVQLELDPQDRNRYLTDSGYRAFATYEEPIKIKGMDKVLHPLRYSLWGPVVNNHRGGAGLHKMARSRASGNQPSTDSAGAGRGSRCRPQDCQRKRSSAPELHCRGQGRAHRVDNRRTDPEAPRIGPRGLGQLGRHWGRLVRLGRSKRISKNRRPAFWVHLDGKPTGRHRQGTEDPG